MPEKQSFGEEENRCAIQAEKKVEISKKIYMIF